MQLRPAWAWAGLALLAGPAWAADGPVQDYLAHTAEAARMAKEARDLMADGQSGKACARSADAAAAYGRSDASLAHLQATLPGGAASDSDLADYVKVVAAQAADAAGWRKTWCAQVPMDSSQLAARALATPAAPDQPADAAQATARLAMLTADYEKALKSAEFHLKAAYKERNAGLGAQDALAMQGANPAGLSTAYDPKLKLWAACMDAGDARKRLVQARAALDAMRALGARFAIEQPRLPAQYAAIANGLKAADGVCGVR